MTTNDKAQGNGIDKMVDSYLAGLDALPLFLRTKAPSVSSDPHKRGNHAHIATSLVDSVNQALQEQGSIPKGGKGVTHEAVAEVLYTWGYEGVAGSKYTYKLTDPAKDLFEA